MNTHLINQIKRRLYEKGLSIREAERRAGLGTHTLNNVLSGRSKKPSAELLSSIAQTLECTVEELLGNRNATSTFPPNNKEKKFQEPRILLEIIDFLAKEHCEDIKKLSYYSLLKCVVRIYEYTIFKNDGIFNKTFAEWELEKLLEEQDQ